MEAVKSLLTEREELLHLSQEEAPAAGTREHLLSQDSQEAPGWSNIFSAGMPA